MNVALAIHGTALDSTYRLTRVRAPRIGPTDITFSSHEIFVDFVDAPKGAFVVILSGVALLC